MKLIVTSTNPVKIDAALSGARKIYPDETIEASGQKVSSGVSDQPMSSEETLRGAMNRLDALVKLEPNADLWVSIEGGVEKIGTELYDFAWVVAKNKNTIGKAKCAGIQLPPTVTKLVLQGKEVGEANDSVFKQTNSKHEGGSAGLLTGGLITRTSTYTEGVVLALTPLKNKHYYQM